MSTTGRRMSTAMILLVMVVASAALAETVVRVAGAGCEWGTFAYRAWMQTSQGVEGPAAVVLVEGEERVLHESTPDGDEAIIPGEMALSPDGQEVVFEKMRTTLDDEYAIPESLGLFVYDIDGDNERRISDRGVSMIDWSPDGETIAYSRGRAIGVMDAAGGNERRIFRLRKSDLVDPPILAALAWSGDSERIAFVIEHFGRRSRSEIWTMSADGADRKRDLVLRGGSMSHLAWSPDEERFAYDWAWRGVPSIVITELPDERVRPVEPYSDYPVWSKDGSRLAYVIGREGHYDPRIVVGDGDGQGEVPVPVPDDAVGIERLDDWASC